ncbi:hypothetical protein ABH935_005851 [Catenulispora sp. GAS73]|uniref:hypothetical protein n=1 Tax=Catenulispora sp. GAS73 TaxID=3156269 RepID=UPI00351322C4
MGDVQAALERGWDLDDVLSTAIQFVGDADSSYISPFALFGTSEFVARRALRCLAEASLTIRETRPRRFRRPQTLTRLTKAGEDAHDHLVQLRRLDPTARRQICRTIMLNGLYHDGTVQVDFGWDETWGRIRRPWCSYAGEWLHERRDVETTLSEFTAAGLVQFEERPTGRLERTARFYTLTRDGVRCIEEFGGSVKGWKEAYDAEQAEAAADENAEQSAPPVTVSTVINGSVTNLHSGTGNLIVSFDPAAIALLTDQLRASSASLVFHDENERKTLTDALDRLGNESDPARAAAHASRIRGLFAKAQGPLANVAIGLIDAELRKLGGLPPGH